MSFNRRSSGLEDILDMLDLHSAGRSSVSSASGVRQIIYIYMVMQITQRSARRTGSLRLHTQDAEGLIH